MAQVQKPDLIEINDFFVYKFDKFIAESKEDPDDNDENSHKVLLDIKCQHILEFEDLDVICGKPQISGKDAALQKEIAIIEAENEKNNRFGKATTTDDKDKDKDKEAKDRP